MSSKDFTTAFVVDQTPEQVFAAINEVAAWWGAVEGSTGQVGDTFTYHYEDEHRTTQRVAQRSPGKRIVWHITDAYLKFTEDPAEWAGTNLAFDISRVGDQTEVRFTHEGLQPDFECYDQCSSAWSFFINTSLRSLITTGKGRPSNGDSAYDAVTA